MTQTAWDALTARRLRLLGSWWPWRCAGYLLCSPLVAYGWLMTCLPLGPWAGIPLGALERRRLSWVEGGRQPSPHTPPARPGPGGWLAGRLRERATWQELGYGLLLLPLSVVDFFVPFMLLAIPLTLVLAPLTAGRRGDGVQVLAWLRLDAAHLPGAVLAPVLGLVLLAAGLYLITAVTAARALVVRSLLVGDREAALGSRVRELTASRTRVVAGFEFERRRIERDLHDGAQQRLTSLLMTLGMLRVRLRDGDPDARALVDKAHEEAARALRELRDLVHGIYPATLRERGLPAMLAELADDHPLPVELRVDLPRRPSAGVESTLWFAIAEALSNVVKHSGPAAASVSVVAVGARIVAEVRDDGAGGADPAGGGLAGIADRVEAYGGTVLVRSPAGGPTIVTMEIPCAS
ncbi:sensor histidine kinase [Actinoplanes sp. RD1]|uniref:sensor histidine kinase n=1 Tax=Actinoplanes sp. RD1 TaxID=3064538 RepID=UPI002741584F|nr:sensor domain-containing protein [Actinoplanes sp. RD1]